MAAPRADREFTPLPAGAQNGTQVRERAKAHGTEVTDRGRIPPNWRTLRRRMFFPDNAKDASQYQRGGLPLPLGEPDPARRLELIAAETAARKHKDRPQASTGIFRFVAGQRAWYRHFPRQRSVNLVVTNAPGPPVPLYLAGARLLELFPMMPVMGNLTLVVAVLSYAGQLNLTAVADHDHCPDLEIFTHGVHTALDDLEQSTLVPASCQVWAQPSLQHRRRRCGRATAPLTPSRSTRRATSPRSSSKRCAHRRFVRVPEVPIR